MPVTISPVCQCIASDVAALGTAVRRRQLIDKGYTDWDIRQAIGAGAIRRISRGVYSIADSSPMAEYLAQHQAELTCFGRARTIGLWVLKTQDVPHVAVASGRKVPGCVTHRIKGKLSLPAILRHCAQCGTDVEILCVLESAVINKDCTLAQLRLWFNRRNDVRVRKVIDMVDPQSMSIGETCSRYHLRTAGYNVQGQAYIRGMGHLDGLVDGRLGLEIDGKEYHNNEKAWQEDLRRGNVLVVNDVPTLHFRAAVAMYFPDELLRWVREALETIAVTRR